MAARGARHLVTQGGCVAKMAFALPAARSVLRNPTQAELHALAKAMPNARETSYGAVNIQTQVLSRSKGSTFIVADDPDVYPHQAIDRDEWERMSERQDAYIAEAEMIQVDGFIGADPEHRVGVREHRRHAGRPLLPRRRCGL
jgi:phosphoenolpyruvate carboxykinase (ATP)